MLNWPWTTWKNISKELITRKQECEDHPEKLIKLESVDEFIDSLQNYKPSVFTKFKWWLNDVVWEVYRYFKPCHQQIRKSIPKKWIDLTELIRIVNFEFLKSYHDNEMDIIDWDHDEKYQEVRDWIIQAYAYITIDRPKLEDDLTKAYPPLKAKGTYEEKYGEVNRLEALIEKKDTEVLVELVKKRGWFWS